MEAYTAVLRALAATPMDWVCCRTPVGVVTDLTSSSVPGIHPDMPLQARAVVRMQQKERLMTEIRRELNISTEAHFVRVHADCCC